MATDFFERQEVARRNTARLVILFVLAVLAIMGSIWLLLAITMGVLAGDSDAAGLDWTFATAPEIIGLAVIGTLLVVGGGSLFKMAQLRAGGRVIAEELGGRRLNPDTDVVSEQRVLNVVEEIAIASGMPAPPVYLLEQEPSVNAFAAGFSPNDAVVGVTRGTVEHLSRDELQGVIAHEFSHILNGDMRLNIRLIGLLHGILIIGMLGYFILRMTAYSGVRRGRSRREGNPLPVLALGAGLVVIGFFGTFFGNLIKAAVSRQREFLADASAVQFTRQSDGIAGALKKIGGLATGSTIRSPNAPEASHLFFGRATSGLSGLFSTHPPLQERIRRLEPSWDGSFPEVVPGTEVPVAHPRAAGTAGFAGAESGGVATPESLTGAVDRVGRPSELHLRYAGSLVRSLPPPLVRAAHEPYGARAVVYALLLDRDADIRGKQLAHLADAADPGVYDETVRLRTAIEQLDTRARLPLLDMTLPALRALTREQYDRFTQNIAHLAHADARIELFEWVLHRILLHDLGSHYREAKPSRVRHYTLAAVQPECELLLSTLAHAGHRDVEAARHAFEQGWRTLRLPPARPRPAEPSGLAGLERALTTLDEAAPRVKERLLRAAVACIAADQKATAAEAELLRAISASLGCPMPPLLVA